MRILLTLCILLTSLSLQARRGKKITVNEPIRIEINNVIEHAYRLQQSLYQQREPSVITAMQSLQFSLKKAETVSKRENLQGPHIQRILEAIGRHVNQAQASKKRMQNLILAYKQLVILYESYSTLKKYHVFFCRSDRSVWIQEGWKTQNPFTPNSECGRAT